MKGPTMISISRLLQVDLKSTPSATDLKGENMRALNYVHLVKKGKETVKRKHYGAVAVTDRTRLNALGQ